MQKLTETTWRPTWWTPMIIGLVFLLIVGLFLPGPLGWALWIACVIVGLILYRQDQNSKYEHFREMYLKQHPDPESGPSDKP
jgi:4-hydroxybenzoate polyprenyltransferase